MIGSHAFDIKKKDDDRVQMQDSATEFNRDVRCRNLLYDSPTSPYVYSYPLQVGMYF
jgi:hypothetical protein